MKITCKTGHTAIHAAAANRSNYRNIIISIEFTKKFRKEKRIKSTV